MSKSAPHHDAAKAPSPTASQTSKEPKDGNTYVGLTLILVWYYCFWFIPQSFSGVSFLGWEVTAGWLVFLVASILTFWLVPVVLGKTHHLTGVPMLDVACALVLSVGGFLMNSSIIAMPLWVYSGLLPALIGIAEAIFWLLWGECYARMKAAYTERRVSLAFGAVSIAAICVITLLPSPLNAFATAALPLISLRMLKEGNAKAGDTDYPKLLPGKTRIGIRRNLAAVAFTIVIANILCYFVTAIIPTETLPFGDNTFTLAVLSGAFGMLIIVLLSRKLSGRFRIFRIVPWLLVFSATAGLFYLSERTVLYLPAFMVALGISSIVSIVLIMYSGTLIRKGYIRASTAYGLSGLCIRSGVLLGNGTAIFFEQNPTFQEPFLVYATLIFVGALVLMLVPFLRQEHRLGELMAPVETKSDLKAAVDAVVEEFKLSKREAEILLLTARGYTAGGIAKQLVISTYTVQTHIQHIYTKTGIHRRAELLAYINKMSDE